MKIPRKEKKITHLSLFHTPSTIHLPSPFSFLSPLPSPFSPHSLSLSPLTSKSFFNVSFPPTLRPSTPSHFSLFLLKLSHPWLLIYLFIIIFIYEFGYFCGCLINLCRRLGAYKSLGLDQNTLELSF